MQYAVYFQSPAGPLQLLSDGVAVTGLGFACTVLPHPCPLLEQAAQQLAEYFDGRRRDFTVALAPRGTPFQMAVWQALRAIPYGETRTYGQIAAAVGSPKACRAVGMACHQNPIAVFIPCHRVVGASGALTGYAGGLPFKKALLTLEKATWK